MRTDGAERRTERNASANGAAKRPSARYRGAGAVRALVNAIRKVATAEGRIVDEAGPGLCYRHDIVPASRPRRSSRSRPHDRRTSREVLTAAAGSGPIGV